MATLFKLLLIPWGFTIFFWPPSLVKDLPWLGSKSRESKPDLSALLSRFSGRRSLCGGVLGWG